MISNLARHLGAEVKGVRGGLLGLGMSGLVVGAFLELGTVVMVSSMSVAQLTL